MTLDHVGAVLFPEFLFLRFIGRLAFPIFSYLIVLGIESTRNVRKYLGRLFLFALLSQIPYFLAFEIAPFEQLNILFTLFFGALSIHVFYKKAPLAFLPVIAAILLNSEGGLYGIAMVAIMEVLNKNLDLGVLLVIVFTSLVSFVLSIQLFSLIALPVVFLHKRGWLRREKDYTRSSLRRYSYYFYYPLHLALLYLIKTSLF